MVEVTQEQLKYIGHLRSLGIEPLDAINMAQQAGPAEEGKSVYDGRYEDAADAVWSFARWDDTEEGVDYWLDKARSYSVIPITL